MFLPQIQNSVVITDNIPFLMCQTSVVFTGNWSILHIGIWILDLDGLVKKRIKTKNLIKTSIYLIMRSKCRYQHQKTNIFFNTKIVHFWYFHNTTTVIIIAGRFISPSAHIHCCHYITCCCGLIRIINCCCCDNCPSDVEII